MAENIGKFIIKDKGISSGSPVIKGTRIRVIDIAIESEYLGMSADEIVRAHPNLNLSEVYAALSYYYDNLEEMKKKLGEDEELISKIKEKYLSKVKAYA